MAGVVVTRVYDLIPRALAVFIFSWITWKLWELFKPRDQHSLRSVAIVVLGDIGRSPRMMYHAQSFAENGFTADVVGYGGSKPIPALERLPKVQLHYLPEPPQTWKQLPYVVFAPLKILHQIVSILYVLLAEIAKPPEFILVQNPPTIPTLALAWFVGQIRGSKVIIDWHNLGYSILALKLGGNHLFVKIATWFEASFGRSAYAHLFVTQAMHDFLVEKWDLQGRKVVLHDRPPRHFHRSAEQETHELFQRLQPSLTLQTSLRNFLPKFSLPYSTPFTHTPSQPPPSAGSAPITDNNLAHHAKIPLPNLPLISATATTYPELRLPTLRSDRPALLISSTSWTPDEDFEILLQALGMYETRAREINASHSEEGRRKEHQGDGKLPKLLVVITGKGQLRDKYIEEVDKLQQKWVWVRCISLWLEAEDYPILLGSADLGVCLHSSSSALDLPMKIVDMFGCGLPVCALGFSCLDELVKDGINGLVFENASQLMGQLESVFTSFPNSPRLAALQSSLLQSSRTPSSLSHTQSPHQFIEMNQGDNDWHWNTWDENWGRIMKPLILSDLDR